jgi:hypothetical protein
VGQVVYDALGAELRLHDWKTWDSLSFEIKDRYRRIGQKVIDALAHNDSLDRAGMTDDDPGFS